MKNELSNKKCGACGTQGEVLESSQILELHRQLDPAWKVVDNHHLEREFKFNDFAQALAFTNRVGALAEAENHHPDIFLTWGKVKLTIFSHSAGGLTENDFILASKVKA